MARKRQEEMIEEELDIDEEEQDDENDGVLTFQRRDKALNLLLAVAASGFAVWEIWRIFHALPEPWYLTWWAHSLLAAGFAYAAYGYWYEVLFNRLIVADDGIVYYSVDGSFDADWDDIIRIGTIHRRKGKREYGLVLKNYVRKDTKFSFAPYLTEWEGSDLKLALEERAASLFSDDMELDRINDEEDEVEEEEQEQVEKG